MQTDVLPKWLETQPTLKEKVVRVKVETGGYYTNDTNVPTTAAIESDTEGNGTQITYDEAFLLSQPEYMEYVGLGDSRGKSKGLGGSIYCWLRSAYSSTDVRELDPSGAGLSAGKSTYYDGVRPALWVVL